MYYRRPKAKRIYNYFLPFIIIAVIFTGIFYGWQWLNGLFVDQNRSTINEKVFLNIESGSAEAMTVGKSEWQNAPDKIYLYRGESIGTQADGRTTLTFFDQNIMRMNTDTELTFSTLKKNNDTNNIGVELKKGDVWAKVGRIINPNSDFSVSTDLINVDTRGAVFSMSYPGTVYVMEGNVQIGVKYDGSVIKTYTVGVGQQFLVDQAGAESIKKGDNTEVIFALSDTFKAANWFRWNIKKDGDINAFEEPGQSGTAGSADTTVTNGAGVTDNTVTTDTTGTSVPGTTPVTTGNTPITDATESKPTSTTDTTTAATTDLSTADTSKPAYITSPSKNTETNKSSIKAEGGFDTTKVSAVYVNGEKATTTNDGKWSDTVKLGPMEGKNDITVEATDKSGVKTKTDTLTVIYDKTAPSAPAITEPVATAGSDTIAITDVEQMIKGTVTKDTQEVIVNDYSLAKYVPGSGAFQYYAKMSYGNLNVGDNEFKIYAKDKAGNLSDVTVVTLKLDQSVVDKAKTATGTTPDASATTTNTAATTTSSSLPKANSTGGVKITGPNNGESFTSSDTEFEITGTVPANTAKVVVNDYPLSLFQAGDTTFKYRAYASIGNLKIGEKNTFTVEAYDTNNTSLGKASITIDIESGAGAAPVIDMPTSSATYSTTLDTIVIGGTVGKWVTRMYVNDKEITDYIPGSEKWRSSVKLKSGDNNFEVSAEKDGVSVGKASIKITLQQ
jgi:hypothetical protein